MDPCAGTKTCFKLPVELSDNLFFQMGPLGRKVLRRVNKELYTAVNEFVLSLIRKHMDVEFSNTHSDVYSLVPVTVKEILNGPESDYKSKIVSIIFEYKDITINNFHSQHSYTPVNLIQFFAMSETEEGQNNLKFLLNIGMNPSSTYCKKAQINCVSTTPLSYAVNGDSTNTHARFENAKLLIEAGADHLAKDNTKRTVFERERDRRNHYPHQPSLNEEQISQLESLAKDKDKEKKNVFSIPKKKKNL